MRIGKIGRSQTVGTSDERNPHRGGVRLLPAVIIGLIALVAVNNVVDVVHDRIYVAIETQTQSQISDARLLQTALVDSETGVRGYVLTQRPDYLAPFQTGMGMLSGINRQTLEGLDTFSLHQPDLAGTPTTASATLAELRKAWDAAIRLTAEGQSTQAAAALVSAKAKDLMDRLRSNMTGYLQP